MTPTLSYDDLPPGSDLSREFSGGGVVITAALRDPSPRAIRLARRQAARRAAIEAACALLLVSMVPLLLSLQTGLRPNLPPIVFALHGVIGAAFFLLAWHIRSGHYIDLLHIARRQLTVITADADHLSIETEGPFGARSLCVPASEVGELRATEIPTTGFLGVQLNALRIELRDLRAIDVLPGRDQAELQSAAAILRRVLKIPEQAISL